LIQTWCFCRSCQYWLAMTIRWYLLITLSETMFQKWLSYSSFFGNQFFPWQNRNVITIENIVLMTFCTFSYLPYPHCCRLYTGWLAAVQKTWTGTMINVIVFPVGYILPYWETFQCAWAHGSLHAQAISYSPDTPTAAHINCRHIIDLSGHTVASIG